MAEDTYALAGEFFRREEANIDPNKMADYILHVINNAPPGKLQEELAARDISLRDFALAIRKPEPDYGRLGDPGTCTGHRGLGKVYTLHRQRSAGALPPTR